MYAHYAQWAAKAYVRRAECLKRSYQPGKAREVLEEMIKQPGLGKLPEMDQARQMLNALGGAG